MLVAENIVSQLPDADPTLGVVVFVLNVRRSLGSKSLEGQRHEFWDLGVFSCTRDKSIVNVTASEESYGYKSSWDAILCQSESALSSDGAGEGETSERGACEEASVSVGGITNLVSGLLSEWDV